MRTCKDCGGSMDGRNWRCTFCAACSKARYVKRNRTRAAAWYNANSANAERAIARATARRKANPDEHRTYHRLYRRRKYGVHKFCASVGCGREVETLKHQIKFCLECATFYKTHDSHRSRRSLRRAA